jgi:hypothetical protein
VTNRDIVTPAPERGAISIEIVILSYESYGHIGARWVAACSRDGELRNKTKAPTSEIYSDAHHKVHFPPSRVRARPSFCAWSLLSGGT